MNYQFENKVAFITGASSGIGRATAIAFAREGAKVFVADWNMELGNEVVKSIQGSGGSAFFQKCDVSSESDVKNAVARCVETFGRLDFAFNNAGVEGEAAPTEVCSNENFNKVIDINLKGVWYCMKYQIPHLQTGSVIVNCSSIAGIVGFSAMPAYVASKHAVLGLTKTAALELAPKGIRVNAISPGVIQTPMIDRFTHGDAAAHKDLISKAPMARAGEPEEIASAALWLCSPGAAFVTGHTLVADGGWVAQ